MTNPLETSTNIRARARRQDGYKAHVVVEPDTGIITDTALTPAAGADNSDAAVGVDLLLGTDQQPEQPEQPEQGQGWEVLADSAYGTGDALDAIAQAGHTAIVKPWPLRPAVEGGFTLDDFTVVESSGDQPGSVTCPNGLTRPISPRRSVTFGAGCRGCRLRARLRGRVPQPHRPVDAAGGQYGAVPDPALRPPPHGTGVAGEWFNQRHTPQRCLAADGPLHLAVQSGFDPHRGHFPILSVDRGPFESNPDDAEQGHGVDCGRHNTARAAYGAEWW